MVFRPAVIRLTDLLSPAELARVATLGILARRAVDGIATGRHRSPHRGQSVEFKQHRAYVRGDDVRKIDWKIYGKSDRLFVREHEQESNLRMQLLVDVSGSMGYGGKRAVVDAAAMAAHQSRRGGNSSHGGNSSRRGWRSGGLFRTRDVDVLRLSKAQYAVRVAATMAYLSLQQQDAVGVTTFDDSVVRSVPPRNRPSHLSELLQTFGTGSSVGTRSNGGGGDDGRLERSDGSSVLGGDGAASVTGGLGGALGRIARSIAGSSGLVILVSDLMDDAEPIRQALARFRSAGHECVVFQVLDPDEVDFPFSGRVELRDLEAASTRHRVDSRNFRDHYRRRFEAHQSELQSAFRRHGVDHVMMPTDRPVTEAVGDYLSRRCRTAGASFASDTARTG